MKKNIKLLSIIILCAGLLYTGRITFAVSPVSSVGNILESNDSTFLKHSFLATERNSQKVKLDKVTAIKIATSKETVGSIIFKQATNVTAYLLETTNKEYPQFPDAIVRLQDFPIWIVTIHDVNVPRSNAMQMYKNTILNNYINADVQVVINANTGKCIEKISKSVTQN